MDDLISRQAAIDALAEMYCKSDEDGYVWIIRSDAWARIDALPSAQPERKKGRWILDEDPHDGDCRCSVCLVAINQMHERNHGLLNALTGGKWWTFYKFCPNCGARMQEGEEDE